MTTLRLVEDKERGIHILPPNSTVIFNEEGRCLYCGHHDERIGFSLGAGPNRTCCACADVNGCVCCDLERKTTT